MHFNTNEDILEFALADQEYAIQDIAYRVKQAETSDMVDRRIRANKTLLDEAEKNFRQLNKAPVKNAKSICELCREITGYENSIRELTARYQTLKEIETRVAEGELAFKGKDSFKDQQRKTQDRLRKARARQLAK